MPVRSDESNGKNSRIVAPDEPLYSLTCGPPPVPAAVMMPARPSPVSSPAATRTPAQVCVKPVPVPEFEGVQAHENDPAFAWRTSQYVELAARLRPLPENVVLARL